MTNPNIRFEERAAKRWKQRQRAKSREQMMISRNSLPLALRVNLTTPRPTKKGSNYAK
jgi:hypothetical protein